MFTRTLRQNLIDQLKSAELFQVSSDNYQTLLGILMLITLYQLATVKMPNLAKTR